MKEGKSVISGLFSLLVSVPNRGGTGTTHQNRIGTGTNQSGTGTTSPYNLDFLYFG